MTRKKWLTLALAGTLSFTALTAPVLSAEAALSTVSEYDSLIADLQAEEEAAEKRLETLQATIEENEAEATQLVAGIQKNQTNLEQLREEIEDLQLVIEKREDQLNHQARGLQVMGETGHLIHFILQSESLHDIIGRLDVVTTLIASNKQQVAQQEEDQEKVEAKEAETVQKQEKQQLFASELEVKKAALEEKQAEQESLVASIAAEKSDVSADREELMKKAKAAEARRQELAEVRTASAQTSPLTTEHSDAAASESSSKTHSNESSVSKAVTTSASSEKAVPAPQTAPAPAPAGNNGSVVGIASSLTGTPYHYTGTSLSGFDCSGYTAYVFQKAGRSLPRTAAGQYSATSRVSREQAQPGDLVFFNQGGSIDHVGIYLGGGSFIGSQSSTGVAVASLDSGYWSNYIVGFGR